MNEVKRITSSRPPSLQPSFLTSHQKQDSTASVSIPVSASTHFRAISDTGPCPPAVCDPQPGETAAHGEGGESRSRLGLTALTGGRVTGGPTE